MSEVKVILEPNVYVVGKSEVMFAPDMECDTLDEFMLDNDIKAIGDANDFSNRSEAELLSEVGGRLCYWSFDQPRPGGNVAYLDRIKASRHGSVCEHASYNFIFTGVSRSLTHELVRHRAGWAYSQLSQRYVDESDCAFVKPIEIKQDNSQSDYANWLESCERALTSYKNLVNFLHVRLSHQYTGAIGGRTELRKRARQTARSVLPNCTETKIMATANCRAIRHFLEQRGGLGADPEIRRLANYVLDIVKADSPSIFGDYQTADLPDGTRHIFTEKTKV